VCLRNSSTSGKAQARQSKGRTHNFHELPTVFSIENVGIRREFTVHPRTEFLGITYII
jgi:hypothetical protein